MTRAAVVIPAHDEEAVIGRCLDALAVGVPAGTLDIVVVCNGCVDATAAVARSRGVRVLELADRGKAAALNAGDAATTTFPRFYVDADVEVRGADLLAVAEVLAADDGPLAAAPRLAVDLTGVSRTVRDYYRVWTRLPYLRHGHVGSGVVGVSERGRARFERFPDAIADDYFLYHRYAPRERRTVDGTSFLVRPARTAAGHVRRRVRVHAGNVQMRRLGLGPTADGADVRRRAPGWVTVVLDDPALVAALPAYAALTVVARALAWRKLARGDLGSWERDATSRQVAGGGRSAAGGRDGRRTRALENLADPRTYAHLLRLAHFYAYAHVRQRRRMTLGAGVRMGPNVSIRNGERISVGAHAHVGERSYLWAGDSSARIDIGEYALFGPEVLITASDYETAPGRPVMRQPKRERDVRIGRDVWLGARVIVTAGVEVGDGTIVGAGSVVTRSLPPNVIAVGAPARVVGQRGEVPPRQRPGEPPREPRTGREEAGWASTSPS